ncbi:unnamed protein product [Rotaria magnacalcarata]|uniref:Uncharacterized protein n=2 Tax=Rotaria magnacalcarata TaxID=392030 RepID=A0A814S925_9BILA|nr:unnamed protein product [Rotaria magnacalcarata]
MGSCCCKKKVGTMEVDKMQSKEMTTGTLKVNKMEPSEITTRTMKIEKMEPSEITTRTMQIDTMKTKKNTTGTLKVDKMEIRELKIGKMITGKIIKPPSPRRKIDLSPATSKLDETFKICWNWKRENKNQIFSPKSSGLREI